MKYNKYGFIKKMSKKSKNLPSGYLNPEPLDSTGADIRISMGARDTGKTYSRLKNAIEEYGKSGRPSVFCRRRDTSIKPSSLIKWLPQIEEIVNNLIKTKGSSWYGKEVPDKFRIRSSTVQYGYTRTDRIEWVDKPLFYLDSISTMENTKGTYADLNIKYIIFDEFMTRDTYLKNEVVIFINFIFTVARNTSDIIVYMLGNTVSTNCPYFREFGLTYATRMKEGDIHCYTLNNENGDDLLIAIEYTLPPSHKSMKSLSKFSAFNNPRLKMISGSKWEMDSYPHPDWRTGSDKLYTRDVYLESLGDKVCLMLKYNKRVGMYVLVRPYNREEYDDRMKRVYTDEICADRRFVTCPESTDKVDFTFWNLYKRNRWFYADNTCGETVRNFLELTKGKRL